MKAQNLLFIAFLGLVLFSSCTERLSYFTQDLYERNRWSEQDLKKIQFYVSQDIVLKRQLKTGSAEIVSGKIKMENGQQIEEVVIRKGTPEALVFSPKDNRFAISFEAEGDSKYLMFGSNPKYNDRFVLLASEWKRNVGDVTYDNKTYKVSSDAAFAALLVDLKKINSVSVNSRTAGGRKVN